MRSRYLLAATIWATLACFWVFPAPSGAAGAKRVAVLPLEVYGDKDLTHLKAGLFDLLSARIAQDGAVELARSSEVDAALARAGGRVEDKRVEALAKELQVDAVVWGSLTSLGRSTSVSMKLTRFGPGASTRYFALSSESPDDLLPRLNALGGEVGRALNEGSPAAAAPPGSSAPVPERPAASAVPAPPVPAPVPRQAPVAAPPPVPVASAPAATGLFPFQGAKPWVSDDLPLVPRGLATGDVDGDGRNELVLIDETSVYVYRYARAGLQLLGRASGKTFENYVAVSVGDGTPGGRGRIFVTSMRDKPYSYAFDYRDGTLRPVGAELPWFVRTVEGLDNGSALLGQEFSPTGWPFQAPPRRIAAEAKGYGLGASEDLPKGFALYHFAAADLDGDRRPEFVAVDGSGRLLVYGPDKALLERWGEGFGNSCVAWEIPGEAWTDRRPGQSVGIPVGAVARDLDGDGRQELLLARNLPEGGLSIPGRDSFYGRAEVKGLRWDGTTFAPAGSVEGIEGCVTGLAFRDVDGDGADDLVLTVLGKKTPGMPLSASKGSVRIYFRK